MTSEETLRAAFQERYGTLTAIVEMFEGDQHLVRVAPGFTRLQDDWSWPREDIGLSEARWRRYRELFADAGVKDGIQRDGPVVWFFVSSVGLSVSGASRGYAYSEEPVEPIVDSLDSYRDDGVGFVPLDRSRWYLFQWNVY